MTVRRLLSATLYGAAVLLVVYIIAAMLMADDPDQPPTFVTIGTGSINGLYYPIGGGIAKLVNRKHEQYGFRCLVESTDGSLDNVNGVLNGTLQFGIVQGDLEYQAVHGEGEWFVKGAQRRLRAICGLHEEMVTVLARDGAGIATLSDLRGKRVSIGSPGSGQRENAEAILEALGLSSATDLEALELRPEDAAEALRRGDIDAFFFTVGHPNELVEDATEGEHKVHFVPVPAEMVVEQRPYYRASTLPIHLYPEVSNRDDVATVSMMASLVTAEDVDEKYAYAVAMNLFEGLEEFKGLHPAFALFTRSKMLGGFSAPIHPGALLYYRQAGLVDQLGEGERP